MSLFSEQYCLPKKNQFSRLGETHFQENFQHIVHHAWISPSVALTFAHMFLQQHSQHQYRLSLAGGALRDAYVALRYLHYVAINGGFFDYNYWDIFWHFMYYWVKDYDIWVHVDSPQGSDARYIDELIAQYRQSIHCGTIPFAQSVKNAYENMYKHFYGNCPSLHEHIKRTVKYFDPPNYAPPNFSYFGKLQSVGVDAYKEFFPEGIGYLSNIDIAIPYLFDESHIGQYVSPNSHFLPNTPIVISIQIMITTKPPMELLSSFDWNVNRFGWTIDPFTRDASHMTTTLWHVPQSPFRFHQDAVPHANPMKSLMRLANLSAKYSAVPLEIQYKYPKIAWKKILKKMYTMEGMSFQLKDDFLYEIICRKLFAHDNTR